MSTKWPKDAAETVRQMIFKEDEFTNHRLTWLVTLQGLLFAALGFAWEKPRLLIMLLAVTGVVVSITSYVALWIAGQAIGNLESEWDEHRPEDYLGPDVIGYRILNKRVIFFLPWCALPRFFIVVWIGIAILRWF